MSRRDLYANDGMHYLTRRPDEILTEIRVPDQSGWKSTYWKLRRRGSFDFPVAAVRPPHSSERRRRKSTMCGSSWAPSPRGRWRPKAEGILRGVNG